MLLSRRISAAARPIVAVAWSNVMFSSWPSSAFVAGEKIGVSSRADSTKPGGSGSPARVPDPRYSFHAEPAM